MSAGGLGSISSNAGSRPSRYGAGFGNTAQSSANDRDRNVNRATEVQQVRIASARVQNHPTAEYVPGRAGAGWSDDEFEGAPIVQSVAIEQHDNRDLDTFLRQRRPAYLRPSECAQYVDHQAATRTISGLLKTLTDYVEAQIQMGCSEDGSEDTWRRCSNALLLIESVLQSDRLDSPSLESLNALACWCASSRDKLAAAKKLNGSAEDSLQAQSEIVTVNCKLRKLELSAARIAALLKDRIASQ